MRLGAVSMVSRREMKMNESFEFGIRSIEKLGGIKRKEN